MQSSRQISPARVQGNDVLRKRVLEGVTYARELEAEIAHLKGED